MSTLKEYRTELGLSLEDAAVALGYAATSASWLSEIENGKRDASLRLALRIERWSGGEVLAGSVCKEMADHQSAPSVDSDTMAAGANDGAEKAEANISRTGIAA